MLEAGVTSRDKSVKPLLLTRTLLNRAPHCCTCASLREYVCTTFVNGSILWVCVMRIVITPVSSPVGPFRTAVPLWGQITWNLRALSPKWDRLHAVLKVLLEGRDYHHQQKKNGNFSDDNRRLQAAPAPTSAGRVMRIVARTPMCIMCYPRINRCGGGSVRKSSLFIFHFFFILGRFGKNEE